jgi:hypothetical protein
VSRRLIAVETWAWLPPGEDAEPTADDLVAHLQARPDIAVEVVERAKVALEWSKYGHGFCRRRLDGVEARVVDLRLSPTGKHCQVTLWLSPHELPAIRDAVVIRGASATLVLREEEP